MTDYIKREDAINELCRRGCETERSGKLVVSMCEAKQFAVDVIGDVPSADVRENVRGEWYKNKVAFYKQCSCCGCDVLSNLAEVFLRDDDDYNFCPNCGAEMHGGEKDG